MQLIPRGALHAAGRVLPPHFITKADDERWAIYVPTAEDAARLHLIADGVDIPDAYQSWLDVLRIPALVFEEAAEYGWVRLRFEDLRDLGWPT